MNADVPNYEDNSDSEEEAKLKPHNRENQNSGNLAGWNELMLRDELRRGIR